MFDQIVASIHLPTTLGNTRPQSKPTYPIINPTNTDYQSPNEITPEQHKQGWTKAKEITSSSLLGTHFGHYKAGATDMLMNSLHTMLMDIPLYTGFLYHQ